MSFVLKFLSEIETEDGYTANLFAHRICSEIPETYNLETGLFNLVDEMVIDIPLHFNSTGNTHLIVDDFGISYTSGLPVPITNYSEAYSSLQRIRDAVLAHAANESVHDAADISSFSSIPEMPNYNDVSAVVAFANDLKDAWNNHINLTGLVHGTSDGYSELTSSDAVDDSFFFSSGLATVRIIAFDINNGDGYVWEHKFGFYIGLSGDISLFDYPNHLVTTIAKPSLPSQGAINWLSNVDFLLKDILIQVTGETGKTIRWLCELEYNLNVFNTDL